MPTVKPSKDWASLVFARQNTDSIRVKNPLPAITLNTFVEKELRKKKEAARIISLTKSISTIYESRPFIKCEIRCDRCNDESLIHAIVNSRRILTYKCESTCGTYYRGPLLNQKKGK